MKFSRDSFDPEVISGIIPWFSLENEGGREKEKKSKREREREKEMIFFSFYFYTEYHMIYLPQFYGFYVLILTPWFSFRKKAI